MNRIQKLPESVKNKIAAGEVVEGPFSVIKELIENSIDAQATEIDVEVFDSGFKKIAVKDNGTGIYKEDLPLAVESHATSKISDVGDIDKIVYYGFRGEALASIRSISRLTILSRSTEEDLGANLVSSEENIKIMDYAGPAGTTIIVENLFYNIPARKKFLKSKSAELRKIKEIFLKIALANPDISFSLNSDENRIITLAKTGKIEERIEQIYGKSILENLYFERVKDRAEISGFFSRPDYLKSSRSMQIMYVNNRLLEYKYLGFLLSKAYEAIAPKGSYPAAIIFIKIDPGLIDINIHPAKKEIKFFDQNYINNLILQISNKVLGRAHNLNIFSISADKDLRNERIQSSKASIPANKNREALYQQKDDSLKLFIRDTQKLYKEIDEQYGFRYLGIIFNTYIVIEKDEIIKFIDFHAAHERYIYDSIKDSTDLETQSLIFPQVLELSIEDYQLFLEKKDYFIDIGFDIDIFSGNSIVVRGIPSIIKDLNLEGFISDTLESLKNERDHIKDMNITIAEKLACHSAMRSGDSLSAEDARLIAKRALSGDHDMRCPHGRPYIYMLEKKDLEKAFKRI